MNARDEIQKCIHHVGIKAFIAEIDQALYDASDEYIYTMGEDSREEDYARGFATAILELKDTYPSLNLKVKDEEEE